MELIRTQAEAPEDWPWYPVELRGHADTYEKGIERTEVLEKKPYAYSTDSETHAKAKADEITDILKNRHKQVSKTVREVLAISEHSTSSEDQDDSNSELDYIEGTSSDEASAKLNKARKNQQKAKRVVTSKSNKKNQCQPKHQSLIKRTAKSSTAGGSEQSSRSEGIPSHSKLRQKDNLSLKNSASKNTLDSRKQATNPNSVSPETVLPLERNTAIQKSPTEAPCTLQESTKDFPEGIQSVYLAVTKLTLKVVDVVSELRSLRSSIERSLKSKVDQVSIITFVEKYNFTKLVTVADFEAFDGRLKNDTEYTKELKVAMECLLDSELQRTITAIIKKLFHRVFAMQCTAFRKSKEKFLLKDTQFYDLLYDFVSRFHKGSTGGVVTEKEFYQTLSNCLTNAKDWEGNRKNRVTPAMAQVEAPAGVPGEVPAGVAPQK